MRTRITAYLSIFIAVLFCTAAAAQVRKGGVAPAFELQLSSGEHSTLEDYTKSGKAVLLHFWATWCPPCREELPAIDAMAKRLGSTNSKLSVLCVCVGDEERSRAEFMKQNGYTFTGGLDADGKVAAAYGVSGIPTSVIIGADGKVKNVHIGRMRADELRKFIEDYE